MWLHIPTSASSPAPADSTSLSESQSRSLAALVTVSGKDRQPQYWRRVWQKEFWTTLLSGLTLEPSQASFIVAEWLESLEGSPAPICPSLADKPESPASTPAFGLSTLDSFAKFNPDGSLSKTSRQFSIWETDQPYLENLPRAGLMRSGYLFERPTLALRTSASGCSSWLTPHGMNGIDSTGKVGAGGEFAKQATNWPTPRSEDSESAGNHPGAVDSLTGATKLWATPRTITGGGESAQRKKELGRDESGGGDLQSQALQWPTPAARDYKSPNADPNQHEDQLANFVSHSFLPDPETPTHGAESSPSGQTSRRRLNPNFVDWMMSWPPGFTDYALAETGSLAWLARLRGEFLEIVRRIGK